MTTSVLFYLPRSSGWLLLLLGFRFLAAVENAPAELVFTNFNAARPLQIMAVGDSITDDCSINGAWRQYLQQFLVQNGYACEVPSPRANNSRWPGMRRRQKDDGFFLCYDGLEVDASAASAGQH